MMRFVGHCTALAVVRVCDFVYECDVELSQGTSGWVVSRYRRKKMSQKGHFRDGGRSEPSETDVEYLCDRRKL